MRDNAVINFNEREETIIDNESPVTIKIGSLTIRLSINPPTVRETALGTSEIGLNGTIDIESSDAIGSLRVSREMLSDYACKITIAEGLG